MNWIFIVAVIVLIAIIVLIKLSQNRVTEPSDYPYQKTGGLLSSAERSFYGVLEQVVGENAKILMKVRVADVVMPRKDLNRSEWQKAFNKISGKHFDFLLCDNNSLSVICPIELDDSSHKSKRRKQRDAFLNGVCNAAGIPLIQVTAKSAYVLDEIKQLLTPHLNFKETVRLTEEKIPKKSVTSEKVCPRCSSPMVMRIAKKGANIGKQFWACSAYPKCKHTESINA